MKKQSVKKLVLAKETLRSLEDIVLEKAAGGATEPASACMCQVNTYYNSCQMYCQREPYTGVTCYC